MNKKWLFVGLKFSMTVRKLIVFAVAFALFPAAGIAMAAEKVVKPDGYKYMDKLFPSASMACAQWAKANNDMTHDETKITGQPKYAGDTGVRCFYSYEQSGGTRAESDITAVNIVCPGNSNAVGLDSCECSSISADSGPCGSPTLAATTTPLSASSAGPVPKGKWAFAQRWKGEWLTVQSLVSGRKIKDLNDGNAMIEEYYLDDGEFDAFKDKELIEVKGDYAGVGWKLTRMEVGEAAAVLQKKEEGFRDQAKKLVRVSKKYGLKPVYVVKLNQETYWKELLQTTYPEIEWRFWDRANNKIVYPVR